MDWDGAECAPAPRARADDVRATVSVFFSDHPSGQVAAKRRCFSCAIQFDCLRFSLTSDNGGPERFGVWGGLSQSERFALSDMLNNKGTSL